MEMFRVDPLARVSRANALMMGLALKLALI